jgi:zinc transporter ZupT
MQQNAFSPAVTLALGVAVGTATGVAVHNIPAGVGVGAVVAGTFSATRALVQIVRARR